MNQKRWLGVFLIVLGGVVILGNLGVVEKSFWQLLATYWPVILILAGLYNLATNPAGRFGGFMVLLAGSLFLIHNLDQVNIFQHISFWPVILILAGLWFLFRSRAQPTKVNQDSLSVFTLFSGTNNKVISQEFKGGSSITAFGGADIDFRDAKLSRGEAKFDIFTMFGGTEIYVPENWKVTIRGLPLFGGWDDKTSDPSPETEGKPPTLIINCLVLFGGLEIKN